MSLRIVKDFYERQEVVEVPVVEEFFPEIFKVSTCLYVGIRPEGWGGCEHPNSLHQALLKLQCVDGVELDPGYVRRLRSGSAPIWLNYLFEKDITNIQTRIDILPVKFELVVWWHGPEHSKDERAAKIGLANCEALALDHVLIGMPWSPRGTQNTTDPGMEGEKPNPHEAHGWWPTPQDLSDLGWDTVGLNCVEDKDLEKEGAMYGHMLATKNTR